MRYIGGERVTNGKHRQELLGRGSVGANPGNSETLCYMPEHGRNQKR